MKEAEVEPAAAPEAKKDEKAAEPEAPKEEAAEKEEAPACPPTRRPSPTHRRPPSAHASAPVFLSLPRLTRAYR